MCLDKKNVEKGNRINDRLFSHYDIITYWYTKQKGLYTIYGIPYIKVKKMENEIICLDAEGYTTYGNWNECYLICDGCGTPIHHNEMTGHGTHEVGCPFCGFYIGCDD